VKYAWIDAQRQTYDLVTACAVLDVSVSGYRAWKRGGVPERKRLTDAQMLTLIRAIDAELKGSYGSPRMVLELRGRGFSAGKERVERLMRENGIQARHKRRYKATTDSKHGLPVAENLLAILETRPLAPEERRRRLAELLDDLGIAALAGQKAFTLSGGERRRLEIARALVTDPSMILLDEPFSGVDPLAVYDVQEIVRNLKRRGLGILITDHSVRETLSIVDRAYLICEGKVLREGTSEFLIHDPVSRELYLGPRFSM